MFKTINPKKNLIINIVVIIVLTLFITFLIFFLYKNTSMFDKFSKYSSNDKTSPEITEVTLKSDNTYNENYAEEGNTITLMFKISKELKQIPIVRINSEEVKVYKRNGYYNSYYTVLSQTDSDQKVTVEIESYKDTNGNEGDSYILIPSKSTLTIVKKGTIIKDIK